ncbi:MAG: cell division topological specificity factor MinE [Rhodospirillaceae bacterium]
MRIFDFFKSKPKETISSAHQAKERLQIVMAHERAGRDAPDFLPLLQKELLEVIAKYVDVDQNRVEVKLDRNNEFSTLEVNIELPSTGKKGEPVRIITSAKAGKELPAKEKIKEKEALAGG